LQWDIYFGGDWVIEVIGKLDLIGKIFSGDRKMLKHFIRGRLGWLILHVVVILLFLWLGYFVQF